MEVNMEDKIISVLNNVRTNLSNELETKTKELVKPFDDFADNINNINALLDTIIRRFETDK